MALSPEQFQGVLVDFSRAAVADLESLWTVAGAVSNDEFVRWVQDAYPDMVSPHVALAGDLAASWYESHADNGYVATPADLPPFEQLRANARWAMQEPERAKELLAGSAQRVFFNGARNTVAFNASQEPGATWARHAKPDACRFCQLMATRGDDYASEWTATRTHSGDRYHDNCHCIAVPVRPGEIYLQPVYMEPWLDDYYKARKNSPGSVFGKGGLSNLMKGYRVIDAKEPSLT